MASVVTQNILSLGVPVANSMAKNAYRAVFTLNNINMNAVNSIQISTYQNNEHVCNILKSIDNKVSNMLSRLNYRLDVSLINQLQNGKNTSEDNELNDNVDKTWENISKISTIISIINGVWGIHNIAKSIFSSILKNSDNYTPPQKTIDLNSFPGKIICMCNCNCGSAVSDRPSNNNMTDVLDGVKTTAKAAWSLLKTGATVVGLLKAGTKIAG